MARSPRLMPEVAPFPPFIRKSPGSCRATLHSSAACMCMCNLQLSNDLERVQRFRALCPVPSVRRPCRSRLRHNRSLFSRTRERFAKTSYVVNLTDAPAHAHAHALAAVPSPPSPRQLTCLGINERGNRLRNQSRSGRRRGITSSAARTSPAGQHL